MQPIRLYLHIGVNKTGTSVIQNYCNKNRDELNKLGILYPITGCSGEAHYLFSSAFGFDHACHDVNQRNDQLKVLKEKFLTELNSSNVQHVVISSENFILNGKHHEVLNFFKDFEVKIIVYLRRHDSWWLSAYNQAVRQVKNPKWGVGFSAFIDYNKQHHPRYGNWRTLLDSWSTTFGKNNVLVRPYETQQNLPNIVADFFRTIGHSHLAPSGITRVNESADGWSLRMIEIARRADLDEAIRQKIINYTLNNPRKDLPLKPAPLLLRKLIESHAEDYAYIAREYLGRTSGQLFYAPMPCVEETSLKTEPAPRDVMTWTVRALLAELDNKA